MTRLLLFLLFFVMLTADTLGINLSLAPGLSVKNGLLYLIFVTVAIDAALKRNRRIELLSVIAPYTLCFLYAFFTWFSAIVFLHYARYPAFETLISLKGGLADHVFVLFVFFYGILEKKHAISLLKLIIWIIVTGNALTVIDVLNIPDLGLVSERSDGRTGGPVGESNQFAAFLALFLPGSIALAMIETGWRRSLAVIGVVLSVMALLMTASRGGLVGLVGGAIFGTFLLRGYIAQRTIAVAIGTAVALLFMLLPVLYLTGYLELLDQRIVDLSTSGSTFDASSGRTHIWSTAFAKMFENPITLFTGYGWDTYRYFPDFHLAPHNTYLKIFFELGFIGLSLLLIAFFNMLRIARAALDFSDGSSRTMLIAFIYGLISIFVAIFFVDLYTPWLFVWAYAGVAMRLAMAQERNRPLDDYANVGRHIQVSAAERVRG